MPPSHFGHFGPATSPLSSPRFERCRVPGGSTREKGIPKVGPNRADRGSKEEGSRRVGVRSGIGRSQGRQGARGSDHAVHWNFLLVDRSPHPTLVVPT